MNAQHVGRNFGLDTYHSGLPIKNSSNYYFNSAYIRHLESHLISGFIHVLTNTNSLLKSAAITSTFSTKEKKKHPNNSNIHYNLPNSNSFEETVLSSVTIKLRVYNRNVTLVARHVCLYFMCKCNFCYNDQTHPKDYPSNEKVQ